MVFTSADHWVVVDGILESALSIFQPTGGSSLLESTIRVITKVVTGEIYSVKKVIPYMWTTDCYAMLL